MSIVLDGTNGITTPDVDTDGLTVDTNTLFVDAVNDRVGVGTSSPAVKLHASQSYSAPTGGHDPNVFAIISNSGSADNFAGLQLSGGNNGGSFIHFGDTDDSNVGALAYFHDSNFMRFDVNASERARLDASGRFMVNTTNLNGHIAAQNTVGVTPAFHATTSTTSSTGLFEFSNPNGLVGSITTSGSTTAYNTSSDYRLKEDVQPMVGSVDRLMALKPVNFAWKVDGSRVDGFLAHEAQEVVPECVTGEKDAVDDEGNPQYQGIDQSKIVPLLTAALQEALTKIEALEARVAALEGV